MEAKNLKLGDRIVCARKLVKYFINNSEFEITETPNRINIIKEIWAGNQMQLIKQQINAMDLAFVPVTKIESGYEKVVYDFTIDKTHNFIAEGMIIHNTYFHRQPSCCCWNDG